MEIFDLPEDCTPDIVTTVSWGSEGSSKVRQRKWRKKKRFTWKNHFIDDIYSVTC